MRTRRGTPRAVLALLAAWAFATPAEALQGEPAASVNGNSVIGYYGHARPVQAFAALPQEGVLATGDSAGTVHLWRLVQAGTALGAELRQDGPGVGVPPAAALPGPVTALAFGDARCNGPDNPPVAGCGLFIAGRSSQGFSYLHAYDWRRQRLLASTETFRGQLQHLAIAPGGAEVAACAAGAAIQLFRPEPQRRAFARSVALAAGHGCAWLGYDGSGRVRFATDDRLAVIEPGHDSETLLDSSPRTAFAFGKVDGAAFELAVGRPAGVEVFPDAGRQDGSGAPLLEIGTAARYGSAGVEALAWLDSGGGQSHLLTLGPYDAGDRQAPITHQIERWVLPEAGSEGNAGRAHHSNFNELVSLKGGAKALYPLSATWFEPGDPDRYRYVAVLDGAHRLVLVAGRWGYSKNADGRRIADPSFVLTSRPYARAGLQIGSDGEGACLWPGGNAGALAFRTGQGAIASCQARQPPTAAAVPAPQHGPDGSITIAPATEPLDFAGDRLRAYTVSADGRLLFAAVAETADPHRSSAKGGAKVMLRRYGLRERRWAPVGKLVPAAGDVVALGLTDTATLGIAVRQPTAEGGGYRVEARTIGLQDRQPELIVHGFAPVPGEATSFTLCFDSRDPTLPLSLYQRAGPRIRLGAPQPHGDAPTAGTDGTEPRGQVLAVATDPACAEAPPQPDMQRIRMTVRLPFAPDGAFDLVPEGSRPEYYIINFSRPRLYVLAIGIDDYYDDRWHLDYAVKDARAFSNLVKQTQSQIYFETETVLISNAEASRKSILVELAKLQRKSTPKDWVMIFMAGHAKSDWVYDYYFLPWDYDHKFPHATQISEHDLAAHLRGIQGKKLLILDTCFAGNMANARIRSIDATPSRQQLPLADIRAYAERLMQIDEGLILLAASSLDQTARESDSLGHGVFTSTLLDALRSPERFANRRYPGALTVADIRAWIEEQVVRRSSDRQRPVIVGRADLLRAPFWQVAPESYKGPPLAQRRGANDDALPGIGPVLWQAPPLTQTLP